MQALLLVGGLATRLLPLSAQLAKPLLPLCDRELLHYQISALARAGIGDVILAAGHLVEQIRAYAGQYSGLRIRVVEEAAPLGTAGAIANALPLLEDGPLVVLNADILSDLRFSDVIAAHESGGRPATIVGTPVPDPSRYGLLRCKGAELTGFSEKPEGSLGPGPHFINAGIYVLEHDVVATIPTGRPVSIEREVFPRLIAERGSLTFHPHETLWIDIGTFESYFAANFALVARRYTYGEDELWGSRDDCAVFKDLVHIHKSAQLGKDADLYHRVVVMSGARIGTGTRIENCIIMPGAMVGEGARVSSSLLGPGAEVGAGEEVEHALLVAGEARTDFFPQAAGGAV